MHGFRGPIRILRLEVKHLSTKGGKPCERFSPTIKPTTLKLLDWMIAVRANEDITSGLNHFHESP